MESPTVRVLTWDTVGIKASGWKHSGTFLEEDGKGHIK